ncbi:MULTISPECIES: hypothetical protein [Phocaeicola]|uniref:Outer membrane protein beta-barrel domain-containing protein n=1 Tax=Phocaeicola plebeius TaxID=310297 RepID=A0A415JAW8_9BACT|nr:hypothetical protein [Phocaeicola plebeius]RHD57064.1 hypothetical protein DW789_04380 [Phocaeicola plebeius]RHK99271.1 hypothetical protein DW041_04245 [Phocaeicola plebeius]RHL17716.1 hypothetical protein DW035_04275 [Phocaeicola plebeius]
MKKLLCIICLACTALGGYAQDTQKKLPSKVFVPKGQWIVGSSVSYSEHTENNYDFLVVEKINSDGYSFKLSPMFAYALKDNMALGGRFKYGRTLVRMDETQLNLDDETSFDINNIYQLKHSYSAMAIFRNYIPLGDSKRFAVFSETQLEVGGSQSKVSNGKGEALTGTYSKSTDLGFGVSPGMVAFINNYTAVEVSIGVLGVNLSKTRQVTNQVETGEQSSTSANFKINIFSIGLGIAFYL